MKYLGIGEPQAVFRRYAAWRADLASLRRRCVPMQDDYVALDALISALDTAATHFTGDGDFYGRVAVCFSMRGVAEPPPEYDPDH
jgi:hypothetical protein